MTTRLVGRWRIVEMELWDVEAIDLVGPGFIEFGSSGQGEFRFIVVHGFLDVRYDDSGDAPRAEFSWEGDDEGDPRSGRGWAAVAADGSLSGRIFFHNGDDSSFRAIPANA